MAQYKAEFLAQRYKGRLHPLHHYIFGFADKLARWGSPMPALTNAILTGPLTSPLIKRIAGVAQERQLPRLARVQKPHSAAISDASAAKREAAWSAGPAVARHLEQLLPPAISGRRGSVACRGRF